MEQNREETEQLQEQRKAVRKTKEWRAQWTVEEAEERTVDSGGHRGQ